MTWKKVYTYLTKYCWASSNQFGDRYKVSDNKRICVAKMSAEVSCAHDLKDLIILSDQLETPVHYDFDASPQVAWIEVISREQYEAVR